MNRDMLKRSLQRVGYQVVVAANGREAVELAQNEAPHLILMDMSLPVMDGLEATRLIKSNSQTRSIPVIALTPHTMTEEGNAFAFGWDDYDNKPIDFKRLMAKILKLLPQDV